MQRNETRKGRPGAALACAVLTLALGTGGEPARGVESTEGERRAFDPARPAIAEFIAAEVARDGFSRAELTALLASARPRPELTGAMAHPIEKTLAWWQYRARFVTAGRIAAGIRFWQTHRALLDQTTREPGIQPEYLVAILGMETNYGEATGSYRELDTLMTLAFDYPPRARQYRSELRDFLLLTRDAGLDPDTTHGSYAGALGAPQFMPSSYRRYAVGAGAAARVDLWNDWASIFASTARFLGAHGWQKDGPVLADAEIARGSHPAVSGRLVPNDTIAGLSAKGVRVAGNLPAATPAVLVAAGLQDRISYRAGFRNLHVIGSYNPSINYALAVCDLAHELRQGIDREPAEAPPDGRP